MRVLVLSNLSSWTWKLRREIIQRLLDFNNEVYLSCAFDAFFDEFNSLGVHCIETNFARHGTNPISDFCLFQKYKSIIKEIRPNIVLTYTIKPNIYGSIASKILKIPYIVNITGLGLAVENGGILQIITLFLYKIALSKAKKVFFQNEANKDFLLSKKIINGNFAILPGSGVNLDYYKVLPYPVEKSINFVFISRIMKEKGIEEYIEAARLIRGKHKNVNFHVCGACEKEYQNKFNEYLNEKIIIYHGIVQDISTIHAMSSCTIHPSYYPEGLSNVLLESAACGRPIITTDRAGCREVVINRENGFIVKQRSVDDLIEKIELFLNLTCEERKQMGLKGRKLVEEKFDRKIVVNSYMNEIMK